MKFYPTIILLLFTFSLKSQDTEKDINATGDYIFAPTNTTFPQTIPGYNRTGITSFNEQNTNLGVTYQNVTSKGKTVVSLFIYPAGEPTSRRLRNGYLEALQSITTALGYKEVGYRQQYSQFKKDGYTVNGYNAFMKTKANQSFMDFYECGHWFFKVRITSSLLDTAGVLELDKKVLDLFPPSELVKKSTLENRITTAISSKTFSDSMFLVAVIASSFAQSEWIIKNTDSLEQAAGIPNLYLKMHAETLKAFADALNGKPSILMGKGTKAYLDNLDTLIASGFLNEYLLDHYNFIMIPIDSINYNFDGYYIWKEKHPMVIKVNDEYFCENYFVETFKDKAELTPPALKRNKKR